MVLVPGIELDFNSIKGVKEALDDPNCPVGSIYAKEYVEKIPKMTKELKGGMAIFTEPVMPIKCAGAPHKITFLCEE